MAKSKEHPKTRGDASHFPMLKKETGHIDFSKTPKEIHNLVRGVTPWPGAYFVFGEDTVKVLKVAPREEIQHDSTFGKVLLASAKEGLIVACKNGAIEILELKAPSGKQMSAKNYLMGKKIEPETVFT